MVENIAIPPDLVAFTLCEDLSLFYQYIFFNKYFLKKNYK